MATNIRLFRVLFIFLCLLPFAGYSQVTITATATKATCVGDGTITINVTNVTALITYAIAKLPFNEATVITSPDPVFINLATGDYYYGYYDGTSFVRAAASINVGSSFSTVSPTITSVSTKNYTYCASDSDPLGTVSVGISGGNGPYTIRLLKATDNSEVQNISTSSTYYSFTNLIPGTYKVQLTDNCAATTTSINTVTLSANVTLKSSDLQIQTKGYLSNSDVDMVYNTAGDICSGIKSATLVNGFRAVVSNFYINTTPDFLGGSNAATQNIRYKLEIQNGTGWDVYDDLSYTQVNQRFALPSDRSKWGEVRLTGTYCGISRTITQDYGASSIGKLLPFIFSFYIQDDPANTNCSTTGKVRLSGNGMGAGFAMTGCLPYTLEVTNNATGVKTSYTYTGGRFDDILLDIGQTYTIKITDNAGTEAPSYFFRNDTSSAITRSISDKNNVFIDPVYFSPVKDDLKSGISFYRRPSGTNFNKSALAVIVPANGFTGALTASLISGPSSLSWVRLNVSISGKNAFNLGENLTPGTYKIRLKDAGCFDEVYDVELSCYFSKIEITSVTSAPSKTICDRYVKTVKVLVSMVGTADRFADPFYFSTFSIYVNTVSGPASGSGYAGSSSQSNYLRERSYEFVYTDQVSGTYEVGLTKKQGVSGFLTASDLWEGTTTKTVQVEPNFPSFDLSQSGGIVCAGNTTGDLYVKVNNIATTDTVTYFIKKDTDAAFPANGQTSPVFKGLEAGNYVVRAKTTCYEVDQALILRSKPNPLIKSKDSYCKGDSMKLDISQVGPVTSIKWTLPDGTTSNAAQLALDNVTTAQSGSYKVEINTIGGCYFTELVTITINDPQTPTTTKTTQEFCKTDNKTVADLAVNESGVTWYDTATAGNVVASTTLLENNKVYYGSLKEGTCESPTRLAVTVTLSDPQTPTTSKTAQEFCKTDNKTVADLAVNESGVTWYDTATAGNAVASTTTLENNKVYYGSLKAGTCESPTRLAVTVTLSDPQTPTTTKTTQEFCKTDNKTVADLAVNESGVIWYDAATAGNEVASTTTLENNKVYYGSLKAGTCESPTRLAVTVTLSDPKTPTTSNTTQEFCKIDNKKVSDLVTTESGVTWYDAATAGNVIASTTALENNKVYYGSLKIGTCESPTRLAVTVTLSDPKTPTTNQTTQEFCKVDNRKVSDLATTESGVTWYDAATAGNVVPSTQALTDGTIYYGSLKAGTCESPTRLAVTVTLSDPQTPTTTKTTQEFCKTDNKTVADLAVNESGVIWYEAATGGNAIASTTTLENNKVYYGSLKAGTCESPTRLAVTVTLSDPQTPTTSKTTQEFCKTDNKTVADLAVNESGVTWYDAATGGNAVASTTTLEDNKVYYGSLKVGTCESPTRLAVTVTLSDPQTPTTTKTTQEFCKTDNKTVADLAVNESGVTWYDAATGGNAVASTTTLEDNKVYYGSLKAGTCESPIRLAVTVILSDPKIPTTSKTTQEFCKTDNKTVADLAVNESGVTWYDAATAGNEVASTTTLENNKVYYGSLKVGTCESPTRLAVTVTLSDPKTPTTVNTTQEFCKVDDKKVSDLVTTESGVTWYDAATAGNVVPSTTTLTNGTIYYGSLKTGTCESPTRLAVTVTLSDPKTPTTVSTTQEFCKIDNKKVSDLATTELGVTWYDAATGGNAIASTVILENNKIYYGSLKVGTCESPTRLAVTVTLSDPQTPTGNASQEFCKVDNKRVSDLVTNESNVTWYDAAIGGNVIASTTALENNKVYYGSLKVGTCESSTRLAVTVTLSDPKTPTTVSTTQEFCKIDNKKVSDLATTELGVTWYDAATGGNAIASTVILENNKIYYGSLKVGTCESPTRLAVTVTLSDPQTPTGNASQEFCKVDNKRVSDLVTNESNVTWYDAAIGGNVIASTTALENNKMYYGSLKVGICESITRFAVKVIVKSDLAESAPNWNSTACISEKRTYTMSSGMSDYNWLVSKEGTIVAGGHSTDNYITVEWNREGKAIIKADYIDVSKCDPLVSLDFPVTVNSCSNTDLPENNSSDIGLKKTVDNVTPDVGQQVVFTITAENLGTNEVKDLIISEKLPSGYEYVTSKVSSGNYNANNGIWTLPILQMQEYQTLTITAKVKGFGDYLNIAYLKASDPVDSNESNNRAEASVITQGVIVYNAISPDGDGLNDYFKIDGLDKYPNNTVEIFNRGGVQIFKTSNYGSNGNVFRGISEGRVTIDKQRGVPTGSYFYILRYEADGIMNEKTGYLYVKN